MQLLLLPQGSEHFNLPRDILCIGSISWAGRCFSTHKYFSASLQKQFGIFERVSPLHCCVHRWMLVSRFEQWSDLVLNVLQSQRIANIRQSICWELALVFKVYPRYVIFKQYKSIFSESKSCSPEQSQPRGVFSILRLCLLPTAGYRWGECILLGLGVETDVKSTKSCSPHTEKLSRSALEKNVLPDLTIQVKMFQLLKLLNLWSLENLEQVNEVGSLTSVEWQLTATKVWSYI